MVGGAKINPKVKGVWTTIGTVMIICKSYHFKALMHFFMTVFVPDSGIIGSKEFVSAHYQRFKNLCSSRHEKKPKSIKGLDGVYSLKRLSEII